MRRSLNLMKRIRPAISLIILMLGIGLSGCGRTSVYVLSQDEFIPLKKGETFTAPYDGSYYSHRAEDRIMDAKVIATKLK